MRISDWSSDVCSSDLYLGDFAPTGAVDEVFRKFSLCQVIFPNSFVALDPSGFALQSFLPAGPGKCRMDVRMVGWEPKDSRPEYWEAIRASMDTIVSEDRSEEHTSELQSLMRNTYAVF